ncbi:DivIVA domain-containing protein [Anaerotruncus colihominis]|uniref:DivIVA domain-containing protein n=1 Tax=Anaerotruncus colihominis TaxID=169435 RepID=UPI001749987C|nr:DivIVA domain-containing protein [Anaerotruncus colihominis]
MEENGFKTAAFGGFDKKSVLNYIDTLNEKMNAAEADYESRLAEYSRAQESQVAHIKRLEAQLAEQDGKLTAVAEQLEKEREVARQAQTMITDLDAQNQDLKKQLSDSERELQIQIERSRQLQFKVESLDYKSKKYDEVSGQIGDAMIEARRNADQIIADARTSAAQIVAEARHQMQGFHSELSSFKGDASRLRKSIEEILFVLNDRVDVMQEIVRQVEKRFDTDAVRLDYTTDESEPFTLPDDEAGYLGGQTDENVAD